MKNYYFRICILASLLLTACKAITPNMAISDELKTSTLPFDVKGRAFGQWGVNIRYGGYSTEETKAFIHHSNRSFFFHYYEKYSQTISFIQNTPDSLQAEVYTVDQYTDSGFVFNNWSFGSYSRNNIELTGTIIPFQDTTTFWQFIIYTSTGRSYGIVRDQKGNEFTLLGINKLQNHPHLTYTNLGYEILQNGKSIGAVAQINKGKVWIKEDLSPELKLVLSSLSTMLLLRKTEIAFSSQ